MGSDLKKVPAHHVNSGGGALSIVAYTGRLRPKVVGISLLERVGKSVILACKKARKG